MVDINIYTFYLERKYQFNSMYHFSFSSHPTNNTDVKDTKHNGGRGGKQQNIHFLIFQHNSFCKST